jgi:hypothetical protein
MELDLFKLKCTHVLERMRDTIRSREINQVYEEGSNQINDERSP